MPDKTKEVEEAVSAEVKALVVQQHDLAVKTDAMMNNPEFKAFRELQAAVNDKAAEVWKSIETRMIEAGIKNVKGEWGYITIAEKNNFVVADLRLVPTKFIKKVADTTKIGQAYKLEGKLPKGVLMTTTKYLTKGIK